MRLTTIGVEDVAALGGEPTKDRDLRSRGRKTLSRLLEAGRQAVDEHGHGTARVDDIVERSGHSHGTFYLYFRDRDDLLRSLVRAARKELEPLGESLQGQPTQPKLAHWIESVILELDEHAEILRAARTLGADEVVTVLVGPLATWFDRLPGSAAPEVSAGLLLWYIERAAVRDDVVDHEALAATILRSVGTTPSHPSHRDAGLQAA